uniref:Uncharacterized protein n=1 Tax=Ciona intestinalis TaxID=7719 RepID=H2XV57_CIOIN
EYQQVQSSGSAAETSPIPLAPCGSYPPLHYSFDTKAILEQDEGPVLGTVPKRIGTSITTTYYTTIPARCLTSTSVSPSIAAWLLCATPSVGGGKMFGQK